MSICDSMFPCDVDANTIHPALCFSHNVFAVANYRNISRWQCCNSKMLDQHVRRHAPASKHRMRDCRNNVHSLLTVYEDRRHKVVTHRPSSFTVCQWSTPRSTEAVLAALDGSTPSFFFLPRHPKLSLYYCGHEHNRIYSRKHNSPQRLACRGTGSTRNAGCLWVWTAACCGHQTTAWEWREWTKAVKLRP